MQNISVVPNCNYHIAKGNNILESQDKKFKEYRRKWVEYPKDFKIADFPLHLDIESTNICNLSCPYCAVSSDSWGKSKKGMLTFSIYKKIIDEGAENRLYSIKLSFRGEPLLNNQLIDMIIYAKKKKIIDLYFNTNGVFLTEDISNRLVDIGLNRISFSIDGWDKHSFEKNRRGAKFEVVYNNILLLKKIREKKGSHYPKIRIQAVMLKEIKDHWQDYINQWKYLADELGYIDAREEGPGRDHRGLKGNWACSFLWQRMVILWDGTILPCLIHGVGDLSLMSLGHVNNMSIKEAWHSERNNFYRTLHRNGEAHKIEACNRCAYRALEIKKLTESPRKP